MLESKEEFQLDLARLTRKKVLELQRSSTLLLQTLACFERLPADNRGVEYRLDKLIPSQKSDETPARLNNIENKT